MPHHCGIFHKIRRANMSKIKFVDGELENKEECKKDLIREVLLLKQIKLN